MPTIEVDDQTYEMILKWCRSYNTSPGEFVKNCLRAYEEDIGR